MPGRLRALPAELRLLPAKFRASLAAGTFPLRQVCLGLAAMGMVILAQRVAPRERGGGGESVPGGPGGGRARTPVEAQGRWVTATSGATNFWSHDTGVYQGNGHGMGQIYEFDADGNYKTYIHMEVRTSYSWVQMNNRCQGTVEFNGDHLTLHAVSGHFDAKGTSNVNRDMTPDDLVKWSNTYRWRRENGADGEPRLILDNENAAKPERTEYRVLAD